MRLDQGGLEILDVKECMTLLAATPLGRVVFTDRALPAVQPVNYTVTDGDIVIRTSPTARLATAARDTVVAFEIDDFDPDARSGWSVVMIGKARSVTDPAELAALRGLPLRPWAPGDRDHYLRVHPEIITGRRTPPGGGDPGAKRNGSSPAA